MTPPPANPCIYHITHLNNLPAIIARGGLISDAALVSAAGPQSTIGMGKLKTKRLALPVSCYPTDHVGDYVPFYFCPRSIMLFVIHRANHPELTYRGGQAPIVHLESDLHTAVRWADANRRRWAFSLSNAAASYTEFRKDLSQLGELNWDSIASTDFRSAAVKEAKQAEFLFYGSFPWTLVSRIGIHSKAVFNQIAAAIAVSAHRPQVIVKPDWYY